MPTKSITKKQNVQIQKRVEGYLRKKHPDFYPDPFESYERIDSLDCDGNKITLDDCIGDLVDCDDYEELVAMLQVEYECTPKRAMFWLKKKYLEGDGEELYDRLEKKY